MIELLFILMLQPTHAAPIGDWWRGFCERNLIAEHPYQVWVRKLSTPDLVKEYRAQGGLRQWQRGEPDEYEMALSAMSNRQEAQPDPLILEAFQDYPDPRIIYLLRPDH